MEAAIALSPGGRLGPYEVVELLGAGGMGEVYRARDPRLRRDVAVKVLPAALAAPEDVKRLSVEARAAGSLNHPNILAVYDVGTDGGVPYIVSELLDGESLRHRMDRGAIPFRKALLYAIELARALAAAHEKGITHRDVKPGNVFVTADGRIKLLDFGLAAEEAPPARAGSEDTTSSMTRGTAAGHGTIGYMSPEQILGEPLDARTDIFALGAVLYEMLGGRHPFARRTAIETQAAVLNEEAPGLGERDPGLPAPLVQAVHRCLEKNREERFQSAADLAFHLGQIDAVASVPRPAAAASWRRWVTGPALGALLAGGVAVAVLWPKPEPTFHQLTFHRGRIGGARFSSDGVIYSQASAGRPSEVRRIPVDSPESDLIQEGAEVLATARGRVALAIDRRFVGGERFVGTLAEASTAADRRDTNQARPLVEEVEDADWDSSGTQLAIVHSTGAGAATWLEYPRGTRLYESAGAIVSPRISPDGRRVAFIEDRAGVGNHGHVTVADGSGGKVLTREWQACRGLAWSPSGREVWFTAGEARSNRALRAVDLGGRERVVLNGPGSLTIRDTAADGRVLLTRDDDRGVLMGVPPGEAQEVDFSWFDATGLAALSADGRQVVFGDRFGVYVRRTERSREGRYGAVRLQSGEAYADDISPDGTTVLATTFVADRLFLIPIRNGESRTLATPGITFFSGSRWFPDGRRVLFNGRQGEHKLRSFVMELPDGRPQPITPEGTWTLSISPDGKRAAAISSGAEGVSVWPVDVPADGLAPARGGEVVRGSKPGDRPVGWSSDGGALWIFRRNEVPADIVRLEIATGTRTRWRPLAANDPDGIYSVSEVQITPDGKSYFYSYRRVLSELYVVNGLR